MLNRIITLIITCTFFTFAQPAEDLDKLFAQAIKDYKDAKWNSSLINFNKIANEFKLNPKTSLATLFMGKINLQIDNLSQAEETLLRFNNEFPQSKYSDEAVLTLANVYFNQRKYTKSIESLCAIIENSKHSEMISLSRNLAEEIGVNYLTGHEMKEIYDTTQLSYVKPFMLLLTGKIYVYQKNYQLAREIFSKVISLYPASNEMREAIKLSEEIRSFSDVVDKTDIIGVILPLTSTSSSNVPASEILEGVKYALSEFNDERTDRKIAILIRDSELNKNKLQEIHDELKDMEGLKSIIGPIYSTEVKDALSVFSDIDIPVISPTATDDYLTGLYENFFQANPSFSTRGRLMAQYVYYVENKRKIALLNSIDGYSPILSASFSQEFESLGGKIVLRESYKSGSYDLTEQAAKISVSANQIEGMYIPLADRRDIPVIVSFLSQINLQIPIYGDQDWMTTSGLESASILDNNLIFCSDYFIKFDDQDYQNFSKNFFSVTKMNVNRNILYGYDTMKYLLTVVRNSFSGSNTLKQKMISGVSSTGFHNNICFDSNRINRYMNIIRYSSGKFELIDKFKMRN